MLAEAFDKYSEEAKYIGLILAGYTDLEISLMNCVQVLLDDLDSVLKSMYRTRGETARINNADALGRQKYIELGLGNQFGAAKANVRYCKEIRALYMVRRQFRGISIHKP